MLERERKISLGGKCIAGFKSFEVRIQYSKDVLIMSEPGSPGDRAEISQPREDSLPNATRRKESLDLVDTFELFKVYFDNKLGDLKSELVQDSLTKKLKEDVSLKFKREGNKIQHKFNEEIVSELNKLLKFAPLSESHVIQLVSNLVGKVKGRNKLIRIADTSTGSWTTVREYESNVIASDSEDEKKIRQANARAVRILKDKSRNRVHPYKASAKPTAMETAPNPYYSSNYKRQNRPPFRAGNGHAVHVGHVSCLQTDGTLETRIPTNQDASADQQRQFHPEIVKKSTTRLLMISIYIVYLGVIGKMV